MIKLSQITFIICLFALGKAHAQIGIGTETPDQDAVLQVYSPESGDNAGGLLLPKVALLATNDPAPLSRHTAGMIVYNITVSSGNALYPVRAGLYYNNGYKWIRLNGVVE